MKVMCVFGTRPEAIKMAPVIRKLQSHCQAVETQVCVTAQHREMLDQVLEVFFIRPDFDLNLMVPGQTLPGFASRALAAMDSLFHEQKPDVVLVQGDTTTTFIASLAGFYHRATVAHIEAGLRTYDKGAPFPEEMNRVLTTHLGDLHFAPTPRARENLLREGVKPGRVLVTGNPVIDALTEITERLEKGELHPPLSERFPSLPEQFVLVTVHRRENHGRCLRDILLAVRELGERFPEYDFMLPVHLNPEVQSPARELLGNLPRIHLLPPVDYVSFVWLMRHCRLILSDSGGVQEEAPSLGKPVLLLRRVTERPEAVEAGAVRLVGLDRQRIVEETTRLLSHNDDYQRMARAVNPYGDGKAAERITQAILRHESKTIAPG
jgi:UDP-N-acetylglucosamine 2-epimerase (non-hydrolysing)